MGDTSAFHATLEALTSAETAGVGRQRMPIMQPIERQLKELRPTRSASWIEGNAVDQSRLRLAEAVDASSAGLNQCLIPPWQIALQPMIRGQDVLSETNVY